MNPRLEHHARRTRAMVARLRRLTADEEWPVNLTPVGALRRLAVECWRFVVGEWTGRWLMHHARAVARLRAGAS